MYINNRKTFLHLILCTYNKKILETLIINIVITCNDIENVYDASRMQEINVLTRKAYQQATKQDVKMADEKNAILV